MYGCVHLSTSLYVSHGTSRSTFIQANKHYIVSLISTLKLIFLLLLVSSSSKFWSYFFSVLYQVDDTEVISFLLSTEIIPLCLRTMEMGSELSKTVECCYFTSFCFSKYVKKLMLILFTFTIYAFVWMFVWRTTDPLVIMNLFSFLKEKL